ncbi:hypothetical protein ALC53_12121 [Atta colombica]|uniref:Uncharacterized protein n=1 Tax=Atta colombica TaxID=520822 RepID=A0A195AZM4_9HYME|nr:hypothetical protein ALC53_12121 [Atta colombica]
MLYLYVYIYMQASNPSPLKFPKERSFSSGNFRTRRFVFISLSVKCECSDPIPPNGAHTDIRHCTDLPSTVEEQVATSRPHSRVGAPFASRRQTCSSVDLLMCLQVREDSDYRWFTKGPWNNYVQCKRDVKNSSDIFTFIFELAHMFEKSDRNKNERMRTT